MGISQSMIGRELQWREQLSGQSLIMEAGIDFNDALEGLRDLGYHYFLQETKPERDRILNFLNAHLLVGLAALGSSFYDAGTFWPHVTEAFDHEVRQIHQKELGKRFHRGLQIFKLSEFETPHKNVGEILMHSGVPINSLESLIQAINKIDGLTVNMSARQFVQRISYFSGEEAYKEFSIDRPTWRFLTLGGEISEDFVQRLLNRIDSLSDASGVGAGNSGLGLPDNVLAEVDRVLTTTLSANRNKKNGSKRAARQNSNPFIRFDERRGPQVILPSLEVIAEASVHWRLDSEGDTSAVTVHEPAPGVTPEPHSWSVPKPTREIVVTVFPSDQEWHLHLVNPDDPLLVFDASTGAILNPQHKLPQGRVWVAYPLGNDVTPITEELEFEGTVIIVDEELPVYGWDGWAFRLVDVTSVTRLRLSDSARRDLSLEGPSPWRLVSAVARPAVLIPSPIRGITVPFARFVTDTRPSVRIPGSGFVAGNSPSNLDDTSGIEQGQGLEWTITISELGETDSTFRHVVRGGAEDTVLDPWPTSTDSLWGTYRISITGPLGRGVEETVAVFEGLSLEFSQDFRYMNANGRGLEKASVSIGEPNSSNHSRVIVLKEREVEKSIVLDSGAKTVSAVISIAHMSVATTIGKGTKTFISAAVLPYELIGKSSLRVSTPSQSYVKLTAVRNGRDIQDLLEIGRGEGHSSFNLAQLVDTLADSRSCDLVFTSSAGRHLVGRVQPREIAQGIDVDEAGRLVIDAASPVDGLVAAIYPFYAPWLAPTIVHFEDGRKSEPLDESLLAEGKATIYLTIDDPWSPQQWPPVATKAEHNVFRVTIGTLKDVAIRSEKGYRGWLAGENECPSSPEGLGVALQLYPLLARQKVTTEASGQKLARALAQAVAPYSADLPLAINESLVSSADAVGLIVHSGAVSSIRTTNESPSSLWDRNPLMGLLSCDQSDLSHERRIDQTSSKFGKNALAILDSGTDPAARIGRFGPAEGAAFDKMPPEQLDRIMIAARPIPGNPLDRDERVVNARQLFDQRRAPSLKNLCSSSQQVLKDCQRIIFNCLGPEGESPITARSSNGGWYSLPAISIALALVSRISSRGNLQALSTFNSWLQDYAMLASAAPKIVEQDLVIAELWIQGWETK
jgi:hypothetical protein